MLDSNIFKKLARGPQVVLIKDAAFVSAFTGLVPGDKVVDAGAGSGWLTIYLSSIVGKEGKITAYERRPEFAEIAQKNIIKAGFENIAKVKVADIFLGIEETGLDLITLDLAGSPTVLKFAIDALKPKGYVVGFCPNVEQAKDFVIAGETTGFIHIKTVECDEREWLIRAQGCRPATMGLRHTSFLTFLRKPKEETKKEPNLDEKSDKPEIESLEDEIPNSP